MIEPWKYRAVGKALKEKFENLTDTNKFTEKCQIFTNTNE